MEFYCKTSPTWVLSAELLNSVQWAGGVLGHFWASLVHLSTPSQGHFGDLFVISRHPNTAKTGIRDSIATISNAILYIRYVTWHDLSKTWESWAALITHPIRGTPASILMFFRGIPLLPPRAKIRAEMCLESSRLTFLRFWLALFSWMSSCIARLPFFLTAAITVYSQLILPK